jgi:hypothetical protein
MLLWIGAGIAGFLGFRLYGWWVPAALACVEFALQSVILGGTFGGFDLVQALFLNAAMSLIMFYATFSIGRALGEWRLRRGRRVR